MPPRCLLRYLVAAAVVVATVLPQATNAAELLVQSSGKITEQVIYLDLKKDYLLNTGSRAAAYPRWSNKLYLYENLTASYGNTRFVGRFRPTLLSAPGGRSEGDFFVDDAYLETNIRDRLFLFAGQRNIRDGVAYGANPVDFLGEKKKVDWTLREEERRVEREGNDVIGFDLFFRNATVSTVYAPRISGNQSEEDRLLVKSSFLLPRAKTDISLIYYHADKSGAGLTASTTAGRSLVLYLESALRWGEGKEKVTLVSDGTPRQYQTTSADDDGGHYLNVVIGGHYTFENKVNIIAEYIHNGEGYKGGEWRNYINYVKYAYDNRQRGYATNLMTSYLASANAITRFGKMRQNYIFTRINKPDIFERLNGSIVFVGNLDDRSCLFNPSVEYAITDRLIFIASGQFFVGGKDVEYGMIPWENAVSAGIKLVF